MTDPKISRRQIIKGAVAAGALGALGLPSAATVTDLWCECCEPDRWPSHRLQNKAGFRCSSNVRAAATLFLAAP